jgi:hypothetical protein
MKSVPSVGKAERMIASGSSVGSSSEANSPVSLAATENLEGKLEEPDEIGQETMVEEAEDKSRDITSRSSSVSKSIHQLCVIITEAAEEENNHTGNKEVDMHVDKLRSNGKKEKEKVHVSAGEWRMIMTAVNRRTDVPADSRREVLMGYQYALHQHRKKVREERDMFMRSRGDDSMSSKEHWDEYNDASESSMERHKDPKHKRRTTACVIEESYTRSLSANQLEEEEEFVQETPEAALIAAQSYLLTTQPKPGNPQEHMHQAAIRSLRLVEEKLKGRISEKKLTHHSKKEKEEVKRKSSRNETSESSEDETSQNRKEDARSIIAQARVNNSRYAWREQNYEDDKKEMGALCFTQRVRKTRVPKGFKLPHDQENYDGSQEPTLWLSDYLQAVQILGGTRATSMQSLQLHLTGAARSWLNTLPNDPIGSWGELENQFARNFRSTYKHPASLGEVKSCVQQKVETLHSYIQRWSVIKNSAEDVSDERVIDAFSSGLHRTDLVEEIGRARPKIVSELMETANRFTDGEDTYNNKRGRSPEVNKTSRQRRRYHNCDNHGRRNQIAAGYDERNEEGYENIEFPTRDSRGKEKPRYSGPSAEDMLYGPCRIHYAYLDGKRVSNHQIKHCRTFLRLQNAMDSSQGA